MSTTAVTTTTIVNTLQEIIDETMGNKKMPLKERASIIHAMTGRQLQAGALNLAHQKAMARLPQERDSTMSPAPQLNSPDAASASQVKQ